MALNLETLSVALKLSSSGFTSGLNQAERRLNGFRDKLSNVGEAVTRFGQRMTTFVTLPIIGAGAAAVNWAADLDESLNKTNVIFGKSAGTIIAWSETSDKAMGTSQQAALDYSSAFAGMLKPIAANSDELAGMSMVMTQLTADFGSFHNLNPEESFTVIQSALAGETEAIRRYGVDVSAAAVNEYAWANGIAVRGEALTEDQKLLARYGIILEETSDAHGDFGKTAHSTSNRLKTLRGTLQNVGAGFGRLLLPFVNKVAEAMQSMLGFLDRLNPTMKMWLIGILAAAAAIGPLAIGLGFLISGFGALAAVIAFFLSPIGLVIAAVGLLAYLFRDELGAAISWIVDKFQELKTVFDEYLAISGDPMLAALGALQKVFPILTSVIAPLRDMVFNLREAFQQVKDGNYGAAFDSIAAAARNLWDAIKTAFALIDWGAILSALGDLAGRLGTWLYEQASAVDWGGVIGTAASAVGDITGTIVGKLGDLTVALFLWVWNAASSVPWGEVIGAAAATVGDVAATIVGKIGDLATSLKTWYDTAIDSVNWGGMGERVGSKIGDLTMTLAPKAAELLQGFLNKVVDPGLWAGIGMALLTLILALPVAIGYVGMTMAPKALEFLQGFVTGLDINWVLVSFWLSLLGTKALTAIGSLVDTLTAKGIELITGLLTGAKNYWTGTVMPYLSTRKEQAVSLVGDTLSTLKSKGTELITGMLTGAKNYWTGSVQPWFGEMKGKVVGFISAPYTWLLTTGKQIIQGLKAGLLSAWTEVESWFQGILDWIDEKVTWITDKISTIGELLGISTGGGEEEDDEGSFIDPPPDAFEPKPGGGINIDTAASRAQLALLGESFSQLKVLFDANIPPIAAGFGTASTWPAAPLAALASIKGGFDTTLPALVAQSQASFSAAKSAAVSNVDSMKAGVSSAVTAMASGAIDQVTKMNLLASIQAAQMNQKVKTAFMDMNTTAATQTSIMNTITGAAFSTMTSRASSAMSSMRGAVSSGMAAVVSTVRSGMSSAVSAASGMSGAFFGAGADAIQGLVNGAASRLGALQSVVSQAIAIMARIPSLGNSPWPMMIGAGHDAMDGLTGGVSDRMPQLNRAISDVIGTFSGANPAMSGTIGSTGLSGGAAGGTHHHHYYSVTPNDLRVLIENANAGGEFARQFGPEVAMRGGTV